MGLIIIIKICWKVNIDFISGGQNTLRAFQLRNGTSKKMVDYLAYKPLFIYFVGISVYFLVNDKIIAVRLI